jgi:sulfite oxidase
LKKELAAINLKQEYPGWHGYVEYEKYPDRREAIRKYMSKFDFPGK